MEEPQRAAVHLMCVDERGEAQDARGEAAPGGMERGG